jgi:hypothetical protein
MVFEEKYTSSTLIKECWVECRVRIWDLVPELPAYSLSNVPKLPRKPLIEVTELRRLL